MNDQDRDMTLDPTPSVCFNLWAFCDPDTGVVQQVAAKRYVLTGSDAAKTEVLKGLADSDFYSVPRSYVSEAFTLIGPDGQRIRGAVPLNALDVEQVFAPLIRELSGLPLQVRQMGGRWEQFAPRVQDDPIWVLTQVLETADGRLLPVV